MSEELEVLNKVTSNLNEANLPYMISGSMALNYYALPRMTRDITTVPHVSSFPHVVSGNPELSTISNFAGFLLPQE